MTDTNAGDPHRHQPAHTVVWTNDYCRALRKAGDVGKTLRVLFGGSHLSQPSLTSFGVRPGSWVYSLRVDKGCLVIVAAMRVERFIGISEYVKDVLGLPESYLSLHLFTLEERLRREHPEGGHLLPRGFIVEVALGTNGSSIRLDRLVPADVVEKMRFVSRRGERPIKHLEAGVINAR